MGCVSDTQPQYKGPVTNHPRSLHPSPLYAPGEKDKKPLLITIIYTFGCEPPPSSSGKGSFTVISKPTNIHNNPRGDERLHPDFSSNSHAKSQKEKDKTKSLPMNIYECSLSQWTLKKKFELYFPY